MIHLTAAWIVNARFHVMAISVRSHVCQNYRPYRLKFGDLEMKAITPWHQTVLLVGSQASLYYLQEYITGKSIRRGWSEIVNKVLVCIAMSVQMSQSRNMQRHHSHPVCSKQESANLTQHVLHIIYIKF